jgi:Cys-rich protein (TIGR01571 family)
MQQDQANLAMPPPVAVPVMGANGAYGSQQQPTMAMPVGPAGVSPRQFSTEICSCFSDIESCLLSWCCPCVLLGRGYHAADESKSCVLYGSLYAACMLAGAGAGALGGAGILVFLFARFLMTLLGYKERQLIRRVWGIHGSAAEDFCFHVLCSCCAFAQEAIHIKTFPDPPQMTGGQQQVPSNQVQPMYVNQPPGPPMQGGLQQQNGGQFVKPM